jgi:hypothetical protein
MTEECQWRNQKGLRLCVQLQGAQLCRVQRAGRWWGKGGCSPRWRGRGGGSGTMRAETCRGCRWQWDWNW